MAGPQVRPLPRESANGRARTVAPALALALNRGLQHVPSLPHQAPKHPAPHAVPQFLVHCADPLRPRINLRRRYADTEGRHAGTRGEQRCTGASAVTTEKKNAIMEGKNKRKGREEW